MRHPAMVIRDGGAGALDVIEAESRPLLAMLSARRRAGATSGRRREPQHRQLAVGLGHVVLESRGSGHDHGPGAVPGRTLQLLDRAPVRVPATSTETSSEFAQRV